MQCPTLVELPPPPPAKGGWPWTEESRRLPGIEPQPDSWPRVSIVTPSFNQGRFLEETIRSILLQSYPNLEYFVIDGGSSDCSLEIIQKYSRWLSYWVSRPDSGQSDAINRGLALASGDFVTWINSDDLLCKNALVEHASRIGFAPDTVYVGDCIYVDEDMRMLSLHRGRVHCLEDLVRIRTVWYGDGQIVQPEVIFPRELYLTVGGLDSNDHLTMDFNLWGKFFLAGATFRYTEIPFGIFRKHSNQKTDHGLEVAESLLSTAAQLLYVAECFSAEAKKEILTDLDAYKQQFPNEYWRATGRLAKMGLPIMVVNPLRKVRAKLQKARR
jgi:glycosyltransferase involved in cell wall biosynthesis